MKKITPIIAMSLICILAGCSSTKIKHLSSDEFRKQAERIGMLNSADGTAYIGCTHNRVYLEYATAITFLTKSPAYTVYWTELEGLPKDIAEQLKKGNSPWTPGIKDDTENHR